MKDKLLNAIVGLNGSDKLPQKSPRKEKSYKELLDDDFDYPIAKTTHPFKNILADDEDDDYVRVKKTDRTDPDPLMSAIVELSQLNFINKNEDVTLKSDNSVDCGTEEDEPYKLSSHVSTARPSSPFTIASEKDSNIVYRLEKRLIEREKFCLISDVLWHYNGSGFSVITQDKLYHLIIKHFERELSTENIVALTKAIAQFVRMDASLTYSGFKDSANIFVFANGTLEIVNGKKKFRENSHKDLILHPLVNVRYDPKAKNAPYTMAFLRTIAGGDEALIYRLLQITGYVWSNDLNAKSFFLFQGVGDSGKTTLCNLVVAPYDSSMIQNVPIQRFGERFSLAKLADAKMNICADLPNKPISPEAVSLIKQITGKDRVMIEGKYLNPYSFDPQCKLIFGSNPCLQLKEKDEAFINRLVSVIFNHTVPKAQRDPHLLTKMITELPAFFNIVLNAYLDLVADNYNWAGSNDYNGTYEDEPIVSTPEEIIREFFSLHCTFDPAAKTFTDELKEAYEIFCHESNYPTVEGDRFSRLFKELYGDKVTSFKDGKRGYKGVILI
jgi:P4 family phage/plasmid primase-like protien